MLTLAAFLKYADARATANEAVGQTLSGLAAPLTARQYDGQQLAYDVTVLVPGCEPIQLALDYLDGGGANVIAGRQECTRLVTAMRDQGITQRMTARVAAKFGLAGETPVGNALIWLSQPDAAPADEITLLVCCAGLADLHNESYAELIAAMVKCALLERLAELNPVADEAAGDTTVVARVPAATKRKPRTGRQ